MHTLIFLSSDGGAYGGFGAERFAATSPCRNRLKAVVSLDGLAGPAQPRLELAGFAPRSPAPALVRTADVAVRTAARPPARTARLARCSSSTSACRSATASRRRSSGARSRRSASGPPPTTAGGSAGDTPAGSTRRASRGSAVPPRRFSRLSTAASSSQAGLPGYVYLGEPHRPRLGDRARPARRARPVPRRRDRPFRPLPPAPDCRCAGAWRGLRTRFGVWLWFGLLVGLGALAGFFPRGSAIPPPPDSPAITDWPVAGLLVLAALAALGWWRARSVLAPRTPPTPDEVLAGYAVALARTGRRRPSRPPRSAPTASSSSLPSLYAWLWLPQVERRSGWARDVLYGIGLVGPALALVVIGTQLGLGLDTPLYLVSLMTLGFIPWTTVLVLLAWAAVAAQLGALAAGATGRWRGGRPPDGTTPAPGLEREVAHPRTRRRVAPSPRGTCTIASATVGATIMCDSWPDDRVEHGAGLVSRRSGRGRNRRAPAAAGLGRERARPETRAGSGSPWSASSAGRTKSRPRPATRPGSRAGRTRASARGRRTRAACRGASRRPRRPLRRRVAPRPGGRGRAGRRRRRPR